MAPASDPTFEAPVSMGTGRYLTGRRGTLTIDRGTLTLRKKEGDVVATAPMGEVHVAKGVDTVKVWVGAERFLLRPGKGAVHTSGAMTAARGATVAVGQKKQFDAFAAVLLEVAESEGAQIGKPD